MMNRAYKEEVAVKEPRTIKVMDILDKVKSKVEQRCKRDYFDMQQTYYYRTLGSVPNLGELKKALEHYHLRLPEIELEVLYGLFPYENGMPGFDFRRFSRALFPRPDRKPDLMNPDYLLSMQPDWGTAASAGPLGRIGPGPVMMLEPKTKKDNPNNLHHTKADVYLTGYIRNNLVKADNTERVIGEWEVPRLGDGLGMGGATTYYTAPTYGAMPTQPQQTGQSPPRRRMTAPTSQSNLRQSLHTHQRFHEKANPPNIKIRPQMYPAEELTHGTERFGARTPNLMRMPVEVNRRFNISREGRPVGRM